MEKRKVIGQVEIELPADVHKAIVRKLVDWGYLDAADCLNEDEPNYSRKLGAAISRAISRLSLEAGRNRRARRLGYQSLHVDRRRP
jgi:hypothetical protein